MLPWHMYVWETFRDLLLILVPFTGFLVVWIRRQEQKDRDVEEFVRKHYRL